MRMEEEEAVDTMIVQSPKDDNTPKTQPTLTPPELLQEVQG